MSQSMTYHEELALKAFSRIYDEKIDARTAIELAMRDAVEEKRANPKCEHCGALMQCTGREAH